MDRDNNGRFIIGHKTNIGRMIKEETKKKISNKLKGHLDWNKDREGWGRKMSPEVRKKQGKTLKELYSMGKLIPPTKGKIGIFHSNKKGKTYEEIYGKEKAKQLKLINSLKHKGLPSKNKGIKGLFKHTEETKRKFSERLKLEHKLGLRKDAYKKLILAHKEGKYNSLIGNTPWNKGTKGIMKSNSGSFKKGDIKLIERNKRMRMEGIIVTPKQDTLIETKIQSYLSELHIEFFTHKYISDITHAYQCDILIPQQELINQKTIIECDGCFWHCCPVCHLKEFTWTKERKELDLIRTKELQEKGFKVIRLWEHDIKVMSLNEFKIKLKEIKYG